MNNIELIRTYGFEVMTREQFFAKRGEPFEKLIVRSVTNKLTHHSFVLCDPECDEQGFMIWGDDAEKLAFEAVEFFELLPIVGKLAQ